MKIIRILAGCFFAAAIVGVVGLSVGMDYGDLATRNLTVSGTTNGVLASPSPAASTDSEIVVFSGTSGNAVKRSNVFASTFAAASHTQAQSTITGLTTTDTANFYGTATTNLTTTNATIGRIYGGVTIDTPRVSGSLVVDSPLSTSIPTLYVDAANDKICVGGATADEKLHVMGNLKIESANGQNHLQLRETSDAYGCNIKLESFNGDTCIERVVNNVATEAVRVQRATGYVGINATNPLHWLHMGTDDAYKATEHWSTSSDERLKDDIQTVDDALGKVCAMKGRTWKWKPQANRGDTTKRHTGLVAQEVENVMPEWVETDAEGMKTVTIKGDTALFIECIKSLNAKIEALENRIKVLEAK